MAMNGMSNIEKRSFLSDEEQTVAKKARYSHGVQDELANGTARNQPYDLPPKSSSSYIDLTYEELGETSLSTNILACPPSHNLVTSNGHDELLPTSSIALVVSEAPDQGTAKWILNRSNAVVNGTSIPSTTISAQALSLRPYDICFGLLTLQATAVNGADVPAQCTRVTLGFEADVTKAYLTGTEKSVAVVLSKALSRLVRETAVTLTATICGKKPKSIEVREISSANWKATPSIRFCTLRIIVYGFLEQKDAVATFLARKGLFLQHPSENEIEAGAKYLNPQYLLAPGQDMPSFENLSISDCCANGTASSRDLLRDHEKGQILRIFDTMNNSGGAIATIEPSQRLVTKLKRHQIEALTMMVEKETGIFDRAQFPAIWKPFTSPGGQTRYQNIVSRKFESNIPPPMGGGILADEMGLGKTLTSLSLICHSLDSLNSNPDLSKDTPMATLIVTPKSTIYGWEKQIRTHIQPQDINWMTYYGPHRNGLGCHVGSKHVVLTTYDTLRSDRTNRGPLFQQQWNRIILDEAHRIRNRHSKLFRDVCGLQANYRWCLTGTPIQNSLDDFGALLSFINVVPFGHGDEFARYISIPIKLRKVGGLELLRKVVAATCMRRTKADHASILQLPQKLERIERVEMADEDRKLYEFFKRFSFITAVDGTTSRKLSATNILILISMLRLICDHGEALLPEFAVKTWRDQEASLLKLEMFDSGIGKCISCDQEIEELSTGESTGEELICGHALCGNCATKSQVSEVSCPRCEGEVARSPPIPSNSSLIPLQNALGSCLKPQYPHSAKLQALLHNIKTKQQGSTSEARPYKCVVFSYWVKMLDLIEAALLGDGMKICRIDGKSSLSQRKDALERFSSEPEYNLMLASIGAAGEGIDLTAANSVHIFEPQWNPMAEAQAVDRIYRIGQQKDVEVVRYVVNNSIETWVQMDKLRLIKETFSTSEQRRENVVEARWETLLAYLK